MMPLEYHELCLCRLQAKIFELSVKDTNCSSPVFIRRFMMSKYVKVFDEFDYLFMSCNLEDTFDELDEEYGKSTYGKIKYSQDEMYWIGYIYRVIAIKFNLTSKQIFKLFKASEIIDYYPIYHTYDIVDAASRMIEEKLGSKQSNQERVLEFIRNK